MRRLLAHLAIAFCTFGISVFLTNICNWFSNEKIPAQAVRISPTISGAGDTELLRIYEEYAAAQTRHDRAFFERVESDDFVLFYSDGRRYSRSADLDLLNSSPTEIVYEIENLSIQTFGNAAVVSGRMTATYKDKYQHSWRWVDVCRKKDGQWQIVSTTQFD